MIEVEFTPLNDLGESACERIRKDMEQQNSATPEELPWIEQVTNTVRRAPGWLPWAVAGGAALWALTRRRS
jgi:hypothetical protein